MTDFISSQPPHQPRSGTKGKSLGTLASNKGKKRLATANTRKTATKAIKKQAIRDIRPIRKINPVIASDTKPKPACDTGNQALPKTVSHLKLVASNPNPLPQPPARVFDLSNAAPFRATIKTYKAGGYIMVAEDTSHFISCKLTLKIKEAQDEHEPTLVTCHFPIIDNDDLHQFAGQDDTLFGVLGVRFQMKILEHLLLFCAEHHADTLTLITPEAQAEELEIYKKIACQWGTIPSGSKNIKIVIPAGVKSYDAWVELMEESKVKFTRMLWVEQRTNPAIHRYLKTHELSDI